MTAFTDQSITQTLKSWWVQFHEATSPKETSKSLPSEVSPSAKLAEPTSKPPRSPRGQLGPFEMSDRVLGVGGYAQVVLGRNSDTGERVAVKILDTQGGTNRAASSEAAIVREVAALRRAGAHPNVCALRGYYRIGEGGQCHAMIMELCRGGEMFRLVEQFGALSEERILPLFTGIVAGLRHLHAQGIAHRDLKLENILLSTSDDDAIPKICDLGLAHAHARGLDGTGWAPRELSQFCGSRSYCAPEVMARLGYDGYLADVWSLGVCLFGLASGFFPVDEATNRDWRYERISRLQHRDPLKSTTHAIYSFYQRQCPLSPALVALLDSMLRVQPAQRASLADVAHSAWLTGAPLRKADPTIDPTEEFDPIKRGDALKGGDPLKGEGGGHGISLAQQLEAAGVEAAAYAGACGSSDATIVDVSETLQRSGRSVEGVDADTVAVAHHAPPAISRQLGQSNCVGLPG